MNLIRRIRVETVVMPLVRVMSKCDLSWSDREEVSAAIAVAFRHWSDMEAERQHLEQQTCGQAAGSAQQRNDGAP